MSEIIKDEDGTEREVFTQEEIDAQSQSAIDKYKEENPNNSEELKTIKEELEKEKEKEKNFAKLRKIAEDKGIKLDEKDEALEEKDKEFSKFQEDTRSEINNLRNDITTGKRTEAINKLSEDVEERKKIKFHLDRLSKPDDDQEAFESNLKDAYFLTTKQEVQVPDYISSVGAGGGKQKGEEELSDGAKALANELGMEFIKSTNQK